MLMSLIDRPFLRVPALLPWGVLLVSAASLALAFIAQYGFALEPCVLCIYQRIPFLMGIILASLAIFRPQYLLPCMLLAALAFFGNSILAFYHVGVEQHWWVSQAGCGGELADPGSFSADQLLANIQEKQPKACDEVDWTFLGISMATYNVVYCLGLGLIVIRGWFVLRSKAA